MKKIVLILTICILFLVGYLKSTNKINMQDETYFSTKSIKDLEYIFNSLNSSKFIYNVDFSERLNNDLEEIIVTNILMEKLENFPKTQTIINLSQRNNPKVKNKLFSSNIKITISGIGNSYWIVNGEKSAIPGEIEKNEIRENHSALYIMEYKKINENYILVNFEDDNGQYLGESRTWPGKPELMKQYLKNPSIIE